MRRKIAFGVSSFTTVLLIALQFVAQNNPAFTVGPLAINSFILLISLIAIAAVIALCISKKTTAIALTDTSLSSVSGWLCTFCGAIITMSAAMDLVCWVVYNLVPPPAEYIYNRIDLAATIASLAFGIVGGAYLIMQGFSWMSQSQKHQTARNWLALTPVLWMWFRLARYEISYSSTIDIRESFFDFAVLVFASLFFLQLSRLVSGIGSTPKNSLVIFSLCTAITSLSSAPFTIKEASSNMPIGYLLIALPDLVIGFFALAIAAVQTFSKPSVTSPEEAPSVTPSNEETEIDDGLAWTDPAIEHEPLEPAFEIGKVLPTTDKTTTITQKEPEQSLSNDTTTDADTLTVDDILSEIDSF